MGLTWALFMAGAPSQVVSQWSVNDASTAALMEQFYAGLKAGEAKGAALRAAELALLKDGQHGHPYYWAPFILLGDWRDISRPFNAAARAPSGERERGLHATTTIRW